MAFHFYQLSLNQNNPNAKKNLENLQQRKILAENQLKRIIYQFNQNFLDNLIDHETEIK